MESSPSATAYEFGEFRVDAAQRLLRSRVDGQPVALTPKVFETLLYLVEHAGQLVEKKALMTAITATPSWSSASAPARPLGRPSSSRREPGTR